MVESLLTITVSASLFFLMNSFITEPPLLWWFTGSPLSIPQIQGFLPYPFDGVQYPNNPVSVRSDPILLHFLFLVANPVLISLMLC